MEGENMKRQFLILVAIAAFATTLTTNALGQTGKIVKVNVTFDFQIGERLYPAGEYRIESASRQSDNILVIRSVTDARRNELFAANHSIGDKGQTPRLVFEKYGENYVLTAIFLDNDQWGYAIRRPRRQRENEQNLALASLKTMEVRLAK
jgi:hypothetical protein